MENPGILRWRTWSAARKGMVIGAAAGFIVTILLLSICLLNATKPYESLIGYLTAMLALLMVVPLGLFCKIFSLPLPVGEAPTWLTMWFYAAFNGIWLTVIGGIVGYMIHQITGFFRRSSAKKCP